MSSHLAYALLIGLAFLDMFAGLVIGRGLLKRRRDALCQDLAQDLTDKVHARCDAYRRLEERIAGVIDGFDQHEALPGEETASPSSPRPVTQVELAPATPVAAEFAESLSWMDETPGLDDVGSGSVEQTRTKA